MSDTKADCPPQSSGNRIALGDQVDIFDGFRHQIGIVTSIVFDDGLKIQVDMGTDGAPQSVWDFETPS